MGFTVSMYTYGRHTYFLTNFLMNCGIPSILFFTFSGVLSIKLLFFSGNFYKNFHLSLFFLQKNLQCPDCPKRFPMASVLKYHQEKAHQSKSQICNICGKVVLKMKNHILMIHSGEKRFRMCSSYVFTNPEFSICYCFFKKKLSSQ